MCIRDRAIENLEESIKKSIALQTLYWKSRRLKAECHIVQKDWQKAAFDLKLFTNRNFGKDDPNRFWLRFAFFHYGIVLLHLEEHSEALKAFDKALGLPPVSYTHLTLPTSDLVKISVVAVS